MGKLVVAYHAMVGSLQYGTLTNCMYVLVFSAHKTTLRDMICTVLKEM